MVEDSFIPPRDVCSFESSRGARIFQIPLQEFPIQHKICAFHVYSIPDVVGVANGLLTAARPAMSAVSCGIQ